jgi:hypothetical protein
MKGKTKAQEEINGSLRLITIRYMSGKDTHIVRPSSSFLQRSKAFQTIRGVEIVGSECFIK